VSGHGQELWPRPGRIFAAAPAHTFQQLATAIDHAFARWDLSHLHMFTRGDGTEITTLAHWEGEEAEGTLDSAGTKLRTLAPGEQFAYVFDLGDDWSHLCTVGPQKIDPLETYGIIPAEPVAYFGWGDIPDQYRRRWSGDDGQSPPPGRPANPLADLPPILPDWGPRQPRPATRAQ
jgi:Plasmid pRiA4b ORF-3-like protein